MNDKVYIIDWDYGHFDDTAHGLYGIFETIDEAYEHLPDAQAKVHRGYGIYGEARVITRKLGYCSIWTDDEILADLYDHARFELSGLSWMFDKNRNPLYKVADAQYNGQPIHERIYRNAGQRNYRIWHKYYLVNAKETLPR